MNDRVQDTQDADVCAACENGFSEGETVVQVVEDRHPCYDKEVVLETYHKACWHGTESQTVCCNHYLCTFRLALFRPGADHQNLAQQLFCPFCATLFDSDLGS